jgi:DUF971 family protein
MQQPRMVQAVGTEIAIIWNDGDESFFPMDYLRAHSPSAENQGEIDILGQRHGGDDRERFPGITVNNWEFIGNYAIRFIFSDGHQTGIFSWDYLRKIDPVTK